MKIVKPAGKKPPAYAGLFSHGKNKPRVDSVLGLRHHGRMNLGGKKIVFWFLSLSLSLVILEAGARVIRTFVVGSGHPVLAETRHVRYDSLLGWSHTPNLKVRDMYGRGKDLTINSQGFRGLRDYSPTAPEGKTRIVCLGDSFMMGYGVGDRDTLPCSLEGMAPGLEVVNMGQGGYGLDQMFLWYARERDKLEHQVLVVGFIDYDIFRMTTDTFQFYGKPWIKAEGNAIQVMNVPPPDFRSLPRAWQWLKEDCALFTAGEYLLEMLRRIWHKGGLYASSGELMDTVLAIFSEMRQYAQKRNMTMVIVHLPTVHDLKEDRPFMNDLAKEFITRGFDYLDLVPDFRRLNQVALANSFINVSMADPQMQQYLGFAAHYSEKGNQFAAAMIWKHLEGVLHPDGS